MSDTFDYMLDYTEPTTTTADHWELVKAPHSDWTWKWAKYRDVPTGVIVYLGSNGVLNIATDAEYDLDAGFIDRLQSLKALGKMHFGEDWGK